MADQKPSSEPAPVSAQVAPKTGNGLALTALILGAAAVVLAFVPVLSLLAGLVGLAAVVLGIVGLAAKKGKLLFNILGLSFGVLAGILSIVMSIVYAALLLSSVSTSITSSDSLSNDSSPTATEEASAEVGTRENPAPIGTTISNDEWEVTLGAPVLDATTLVADANMFNDPAPAGMQYALVPVTVKYVGSTTGTPGFDISISFVSAAGTTHEVYDYIVVAPAPEFSSLNELYPGASASGNVVIAVPSADIASGTWAVKAGTFSDPYFFMAQ